MSKIYEVMDTAIAKEVLLEGAFKQRDLRQRFWREWRWMHRNEPEIPDVGPEWWVSEVANRRLQRARKAGLIYFSGGWWRKGRKP